MAKRIYEAPERIDRYTADGVQKDLEALIAEGADELVMDMTKTDYVSSAGIRVIVSIRNHMQEKGRFELFNVSSKVMQLLDITGITSFLTIR